MVEKKGQAHLELLNVWLFTEVFYLKFRENDKKQEKIRLAAKFPPLLHKSYLRNNG